MRKQLTQLDICLSLSLHQAIKCKRNQKHATSANAQTNTLKINNKIIKIVCVCTFGYNEQKRIIAWLWLLFISRIFSTRANMCVLHEITTQKRLWLPRITKTENYLKNSLKWGYFFCEIPDAQSHCDANVYVENVIKVGGRQSTSSFHASHDWKIWNKHKIKLSTFVAHILHGASISYSIFLSSPVCHCAVFVISVSFVLF